ncbi:helix-turn-helix domain-containing protein [Candidatus Gracilibacteria bacterium]|nr:helix-turn-helix domain-containing protein [Candidatus Gracilibacteria bacterium]
MYTLTRSEAAELIQVSTRSIDRYIKAGKIRTKKEGKIIYLHKIDVENIGDNGASQEQEVIIPQEKTGYTQRKHAQEEKEEYTQEKSLSQERNTHLALEKIYLDLKHELKEKDRTIQDLSLRLGQAQEIAKNSVSIIEFKKSQYLLEESKTTVIQEVEKLSEEKESLQKKLKYEKTTNIVLISFCIVLILSLGILWFLSI